MPCDMWLLQCKKTHEVLPSLTFVSVTLMQWAVVQTLSFRWCLRSLARILQQEGWCKWICLFFHFLLISLLPMAPFPPLCLSLVFFSFFGLLFLHISSSSSSFSPKYCKSLSKVHYVFRESSFCPYVNLIDKCLIPLKFFGFYSCHKDGNASWNIGSLDKESDFFGTNMLEKASKTSKKATKTSINVTKTSEKAAKTEV